MRSYDWDAPTRERRLLARLEYWFDRIDEGELPDTGDWCYDWLNQSVIDIDAWGSLIGEGRELHRRIQIDAPEATVLHELMRDRIEIYAGAIAHRARHELGFRVRSVNGPAELDTGVVHGPAGRDIEWGCHELPRYDWD